MPQDCDPTEADFDALLRVAGVGVPPGRRAAMLDAYRSWLALAVVLDERLPMAAEPAAAPRFEGVSR